jgi:hypothetical protein
VILDTGVRGGYLIYVVLAARTLAQSVALGNERMVTGINDHVKVNPAD